MRFLVGGYGADAGGAAEGIGLLSASGVTAGGDLGFDGIAAEARSPSWLTWHPRLDIVYAALETTNRVQAFIRRGDAAFAALGEPVEVGESPCHVTLAPSGRSLIATCWGDGRVVRIALDESGVPGARVDAPAPVDPYAALFGGEGGEAPRTPHAHQAVLLPGGPLVTTDMGFDLVRLWGPGPGGGLVSRGEVTLPAGSGPRHAVWHPSGHLYVVTELSREVFVLAPDPEGTWRVVSGSPLGPTLDGDTAAEISLSWEADFVYVGVRGSNTLATLRVHSSGSAIEPVALVEAGVDWPRHHLVVHDTLLLAGERSSEVASAALDQRTGIPGPALRRGAVPSPSCLVALDR